MNVTTSQTLADSARTMLQLPRLTWHEDPQYGMTLIATGTDQEIRNDVWAWAQTFGMEPTVVEPEPVRRAWRTLTPGWIVAHLPLLGFEVTVAGRLTGDKPVLSYTDGAWRAAA